MKNKWKIEFAPNLGHDPNNPFPLGKPSSSSREEYVYMSEDLGIARLANKINELVETVNHLATKGEEQR